MVEREGRGGAALPSPRPCDKVECSGKLWGKAMEIEYTDAEVVANFSEVIQHVRAGKTIVVLCDGEPWAEIRLAKGKTVPGETRDGVSGADRAVVKDRRKVERP